MMAESRVVSLSTPLSGSFCLILHIWLFPGLTQEWHQVQASQGAQTERKTLCGHAIIWCEAPWPYSPRGPGEGGNGQLISVNCEWVRASEQPFPCSEAWLLWLLAGQEIQTLTLPGVHTQCRAPHPRSLTAHSSLLDSGPESEPGCEASGAGPGPDVSYRNTAAGSGPARPGRRQCSVYLGPQSGGHPPGQQLQWQPDGQHQDPDVGGHGHWQACCVTNSYKYQGQAENLITQTIKSASIKLVITSNSITTKCYNCIQLWIFTMTRWQQTCTRDIHSTFNIFKVSFLINPHLHTAIRNHIPPQDIRQSQQSLACLF